MRRIFISYRTEDSVHVAREVAIGFAKKTGRHRVFRDRDSLLPGELYPESIRDAVSAADLVLAIIGPHWLGAQDADGRPRLADPQDWVRSELRTAFERGIPVVPVLLDDVQLPSFVELPADIGSLSRSTFRRLRDQTFATDLRGLIDELTDAGEETAAEGPGLQVPSGPQNQYTSVSGGTSYISQGTQTVNNHGAGGGRR
ncbi:toll/interleukin-1 receptor domain-containing protein [Amycolatopsis sp. NBC_00348]|uniref:toll/interleukin-1 receptor domain-containing protein n=1 Tax=Amycolatopsis sp. NBC_00348 TaxID=2975956 RepID=UPI002E2541A7